MLIAAAFTVGCVGVVAGPSWAGDNDTQFLLFSGTDFWRDGQFVHGGLLWSPGGADREGFIVKLMASGGRYRYSSGALGNAWVTGTEEEAQALPGWRFKRDRLELKVFAGLDVKNDATSPYDPSNHLHGTSVGVRTAADLWFEPTPSTMIAADAALSSIVHSYSARAAFGWRLADWFYVGPEAQAFSCVGFAQARAGLHLTGLKSGLFEWSAAAGWSADSDHRSSPYVRVGVLMRR
jgi:hypothetical protein